jgi:hypothetical protein
MTSVQLSVGIEESFGRLRVRAFVEERRWLSCGRRRRPSPTV